MGTRVPIINVLSQDIEKHSNGLFKFTTKLHGHVFVMSLQTLIGSSDSTCEHMLPNGTGETFTILNSCWIYDSVFR